MMKKVIKKLLAALLAVAMVCAMAIPAFAENSEGDVDSHHTYSAFQIFKGDVEGNNIKDFKISNVDWGSNIINNSDDFLNKLREADHIGPLFTMPNLLRKFLRLSANGMIPMITASLSRVLYATISTRMMQTRHTSFELVAMPSPFPRPRQVIICSLILPTFPKTIPIIPTIPSC